jgi:hypothetical protein
MMYKAIAIVLFLIYTPGAVCAGDRTFTNDDLSKYHSSTDQGQSEDVRAFEIRDEISNSYSVSDFSNKKLKQYRIRYTGSSRRIIIPVTFHGRVTAPMLLDTGAPGMHISYRLAEELGIIDDGDSDLRVMIGGIGGTVPAIFTIVDSIQIGGVENRFIPTYVSDSISSNFEGLIGMDFMANYDVRIDTRNRVVVLQERPQSARMPGGRDEAWWRTTFYNFKYMKSEWEDYRTQLSKNSTTTDTDRAFRVYINRQSQRARELYNKLSVYASEHSVPLEWR